MMSTTHVLLVARTNTSRRIERVLTPRTCRVQSLGWRVDRIADLLQSQQCRFWLAKQCVAEVSLFYSAKWCVVAMALFFDFQMACRCSGVVFSGKKVCRFCGIVFCWLNGVSLLWPCFCLAKLCF